MQLVQMKKKNAPESVLVVAPDDWSEDWMYSLLMKRISDADRYYFLRQMRMFEFDLDVKIGNIFVRGDDGRSN